MRLPDFGLLALLSWPPVWAPAFRGRGRGKGAVPRVLVLRFALQLLIFNPDACRRPGTVLVFLLLPDFDLLALLSWPPVWAPAFRGRGRGKGAVPRLLVLQFALLLLVDPDACRRPATVLVFLLLHLLLIPAAFRNPILVLLLLVLLLLDFPAPLLSEFN